MSDSSKRVVLVTGAARGIGRMLALNFARTGADAVAVIDLSLRSYDEHKEEADAMTADTVVEEIRALGVPSHGVEADVTDPVAMQAAVDEIAANLGDVTVAICNAGGGRFGAPDKVEQQASQMNLADAHARFNANFFGTVHTASAVAPGMKRLRMGKIVTISSVSGIMARPDGSHADYGASKAAIIHYTKALANELGPFNINVNCVAPGLIRTPRIDEKYGESPELYTNVALRRLGTTEEVAGAVEFLASDAASYISGHILEVTGGTRVPRWGAPPEPWWE